MAREPAHVHPPFARPARPMEAPQFFWVAHKPASWDAGPSASRQQQLWGKGVTFLHLATVNFAHDTMLCEAAAVRPRPMGFSYQAAFGLKKFQCVLKKSRAVLACGAPDRKWTWPREGVGLPGGAGAGANPCPPGSCPALN